MRLSINRVVIVIFLVNKIVRLFVASDQGRLNLQMDLRKKKFFISSNSFGRTTPYLSSTRPKFLIVSKSSILCY